MRIIKLCAYTSLLLVAEICPVQYVAVPLPVITDCSSSVVCLTVAGFHWVEYVTNQISEATGMESVLEWNGDSDELRIQVGFSHVKIT